MGIEFQLQGSASDGDQAEIGIISYGWRLTELTEYQERAIALLSKEWKSIRELVSDEFTYETFVTLGFCGLVEEKTVSPYTVNSEGYRIYRGSYKYFRLKE